MRDTQSTSTPVPAQALVSEHLRGLALAARRGWLRGDSWARNSLLKAFVMFMDAVRRPGSAVADDSDALLAAASQDLLDHLDRVARAKGFRAGRKREEAVRDFAARFRALLDGPFAGKRRALVEHESTLTSAYLHYLRELYASDRVLDDEARASTLEAEELADPITASQEDPA